MPLFFLWQRLGLVNNLFGLIVIYIAINAPFAIFLLRSYMVQLPRDFEDAARVDGASEWQVFSRIVVPLSWPGFLTVGLVVALSVWNEFLLATVFLTEQELFTVVTSYYNFATRFSRDWAMTSAAAVMMILPVIVIFLALQRRFIEGLTQGGNRRVIPDCRNGPEGRLTGQEETVVDVCRSSKVRGCLYGGAIGDAMGARRVEDAAEIRERYGEIVDFVEPWDGPSEIGKGDGRYTDDTHMTSGPGPDLPVGRRPPRPLPLRPRVVPLIADEPRWLAERGQEMLLVDRLFYPEKWLLMRLRLANADPRLGGVGNMVNCGAAMYAAPVGIVNACDPVAAYREAIEIFSATSGATGWRPPAVMAACVAEAFRPRRPSTRSSSRPRSGQGGDPARSRRRHAARDHDDWREAIGPLRDAIRPFDGSAEDGVRDRGNRPTTGRRAG